MSVDVRLLAERAETVSAQAFASESSEATPELAASLSERLDKEIAKQSADLLTPLACRPGCDHCCYRVVHASVPEIARAADYVAKNFTPAQKDSLKARLYEYERQVAPRFGYSLQDLRPACPLLVDGLCSAYEARPFFCRGMNSHFATKCQEWKEHPERLVRIPLEAGHLEAVDALDGGLQKATARARLVAGLNDFGRGLRIAMEHPEAVANWHEGGFDFLSARINFAFPEAPPGLATAQLFRYGPGQEPTGKADPSGLAMSNHFRGQGLPREGLEAIQGSHPLYQIARMNLPFTYASEEEMMDWREHFRRSLESFALSRFDPREAFDGLLAYKPLELSYHQLNDRDLAAKVGDLFCNQIAARAVPDLCRPISGARKPGPVRVGFVGRDMLLGSAAPWSLGWLKHAGADFETFAIKIGPQVDRVTLDFERLANHYYQLSGRDTVPAEARFIRGLDLDVVVFLDLGANMRLGQLATMRLGRVQCACHGAVETTGYPTIDYYLSGDLMEASDADGHYTEKLVRLPNSGMVYTREPVAESTLEKDDIGIGEGMLIVSLQHPAKYIPKWDELYLRINEATGRPIVFVEPPMQAGVVVRERLRNAGVRAHYLPYLSMADYRRLLQLADVVLDTPGWNGGITTVQALDVGAPVVTLPTDLKRGRQSKCFLEIAGAPGLIAHDADDYVALASSPARLREAARGIDVDQLYDDLEAAKGFEEFVVSVV